MKAGNSTTIARAVAEMHGVATSHGVEPSKLVLAVRRLVDDAAIAHTAAQLDPSVDDKVRAELARMHRELRSLLALIDRKGGRP